jgi:hypothetical protein
VAVLAPGHRGEDAVGGLVPSRRPSRGARRDGGDPRQAHGRAITRGGFAPESSPRFIFCRGTRGIAEHVQAVSASSARFAAGKCRAPRHHAQSPPAGQGGHQPAPPRPRGVSHEAPSKAPKGPYAKPPIHGSSPGGTATPPGVEERRCPPPRNV